MQPTSELQPSRAPRSTATAALHSAADSKQTKIMPGLLSMPARALPRRGSSNQGPRYGHENLGRHPPSPLGFSGSGRMPEAHGEGVPKLEPTKTCHALLHSPTTKESKSPTLFKEKPKALALANVRHNSRKGPGCLV